MYAIFFAFHSTKRNRCRSYSRCPFAHPKLSPNGHKTTTPRFAMPSSYVIYRLTLLCGYGSLWNTLDRWRNGSVATVKKLKEKRFLV